MVNLFTTYYEDMERELELFHVHLLNKSSRFIDMVYVLNEIPLKHRVDPGEKYVAVKYISERPTFQQIFDWANEISKPNDINIVANSDIYFDEEGIEIMKLLLEPNDCWALTRWDALTGEFMNRRDSQDSFIFRGKIKQGNYGFLIGQPGCDNHLCYELQQAGYNLSNPSRTIKTFHLHKGEHRKWHGMKQVEPPYLLLEPIFI